MLLGYYITGYFNQELNLDTNSDISNKLERIQRNVFLFLIINTVACFYAFYSLFGLMLVAIIATTLFQFVFVMIYIVLFSTVRKAEYLQKAENKKIQTQEKIGLHIFPVRKFVLDGDAINPPKKRSWKNIIIRTLMLILIGSGPAFFFAMMIHHPFSNEKYELEKVNYISQKIASHKAVSAEALSKVKSETDSLLRVRNEMVAQIEQATLNPDPQDYLQEDKQWLTRNLQTFDELYAPKIKRNQDRIISDSIASINFQTSLAEHFRDSNFVQIRAGVIWGQSPLTFILLLSFYLFLLLSPFISRYKLMIKTPELLDDLLEKKYVEIINNDFKKLKTDLGNSRAAQHLRNEINTRKNETEAIQKVKEWGDYLDMIRQYGEYYQDPAFKAKQKHDPRIFVDKNNLGKHLGEI